jgi:hypothetical protein
MGTMSMRSDLPLLAQRTNLAADLGRGIVHAGRPPTEKRSAQQSQGVSRDDRARVSIAQEAAFG